MATTMKGVPGWERYPVHLAQLVLVYLILRRFNKAANVDGDVCGALKRSICSTPCETGVNACVCVCDS